MLTLLCLFLNICCLAQKKIYRYIMIYYNDIIVIIGIIGNIIIYTHVSLSLSSQFDGR